MGRSVETFLCSNACAIASTLLNVSEYVNVSHAPAPFFLSDKNSVRSRCCPMLQTFRQPVRMRFQFDCRTKQNCTAWTEFLSNINLLSYQLSYNVAIYFSEASISHILSFHPFCFIDLISRYLFTDFLCFSFQKQFQPFFSFRCTLCDGRHQRFHHQGLVL